MEQPVIFHIDPADPNFGALQNIVAPSSFGFSAPAASANGVDGSEQHARVKDSAVAVNATNGNGVTADGPQANANKPVGKFGLFFSRVAPSKVPPALHRNFPFHQSLLRLHAARAQRNHTQTQAPTPIAQIPEPSKPVHRPASPQQIRATVFLGMSTALFAMAFNVAQSYITTLHPQVGSAALLCVYVAFAIGALVSPELIHHMGMRVGFPLSAATYVFMVVSINMHYDWLMYIAAFVNGFFQGTYWILEGVWMAEVSHLGGTVGLFTGIYWSLYGCNSLIGNILALVVLQQGINPTTLLWVLVAIGGAGAISLMFLPLPHEIKGLEPAHPPTTDLGSPLQLTSRAQTRQTLLDSLKATWQFACRGPVVAFTFYMLAQGACQGYEYGMYPVVVIHGDLQYISASFVCYGVCYVVSALLMGRFFDSFGWKWTLLLHFIAFSSALALSMIDGLVLDPGDFSWVSKVSAWEVTGGLFGISDATFNTIINETIIGLFGHDTEAAFAWYNAMYCVGFAVQSAVATAAMDQGVEVLGPITYGWFFLGVVGYVILQWWMAELDVKPKTPMTKEERQTKDGRVLWIV